MLLSQRGAEKKTKGKSWAEIKYEERVSLGIRLRTTKKSNKQLSLPTHDNRQHAKLPQSGLPPTGTDHYTDEIIMECGPSITFPTSCSLLGFPKYLPEYLT